jgi:hypothetical protein
MGTSRANRSRATGGASFARTTGAADEGVMIASLSLG